MLSNPFYSQLRFSSSLVLLSGGQDSTTCAALAQRVSDEVHTLSIRYGQRHAIELEIAPQVADGLGIPSFRQHRLDIGDVLQQVGDSALLDPAQPVAEPHRADKSLPASYVPGRNSLLLTLAAALAYKLRLETIWIGCSAVDYSGYPDCRPDWVEAKEKELRLGAGGRSCIELGMQSYGPWPLLIAPLLRLSKAQTFAAAEVAGALPLVSRLSHTCYVGSRDWLKPDAEAGRGCSQCPACKLRVTGWEQYKAEPPQLRETARRWIEERGHMEAPQAGGG